MFFSWLEKENYEISKASTNLLEFYAILELIDTSNYLQL